MSPVSLTAQFDSSLHVTRTLVTLLLQQDILCTFNLSKVLDTQHEQPKLRQGNHPQADWQTNSMPSTPINGPLQTCRGLLIWRQRRVPPCRPLKRHGFVLHKLSAFRDSVFIQYGWTPPHLPQSCVWSHFQCSTCSCPVGGYPSLCHNELRDVTASLRSVAAHGVSIEPHLQPLSGEHRKHQTAIKEDGAGLDINASGVLGGRFERALFDIGWLILMLVQILSTPSLLRMQCMREKRRHYEYEERVRAESKTQRLYYSYSVQ